MGSLKEISIREYLSRIDFKSNDWSYSKIEEDMRKFLGERPTLDISYQKDVMINEFSGKSKEIDKISKISVIYTDTDDKIKKIEISLD